MANSTVHPTLIKVLADGSQITIYPKTQGSDVSVSRASNSNLPTSIADVQTLANALGSLAFKSSVTGLGTGAFSDGVVTTDLTITAAGKIADARALKTLNDKITTNESNITKLNSNSFETTLLSSGWTGSSAPYSYEISNAKITTNNTLDLIINTNTQELIDKLSSYKLSGYKQEYGKVTIYAWGEKPITDISAILIVRGGL